MANKTNPLTLGSAVKRMTIDASFLPSKIRYDTLASQDVLPMGHQFKVIGVDAVSNPTKMVELTVSKRRQRPKFLLVGYPMSVLNLAVNLDVAVSVLGTRTQP